MEVDALDRRLFLFSSGSGIYVRFVFLRWTKNDIQGARRSVCVLCSTDKLIVQSGLVHINSSFFYEKKRDRAQTCNYRNCDVCIIFEFLTFVCN